jgi:glycosyltransferase involved in cell wall biosynthesis
MGLRIAQVATSGMSVRLLLLDQIKALESKGHEVVAVCAPGPWVDSIRSEGVKVETVPMEREIAPLRDVRSLLSLRNCFRRHSFDVVHTHTPKAGLIGPLAAQLAGVPHVIHTIHGLLFHDQMTCLNQIIFWLPERFTATFCDHLLSQSEEDVDRAVRSRLCSPQKIGYVGNGIDVERFSPDAIYDRALTLAEVGFRENDFVIGSVGRLVREKGFMELFAAAEMLRPTNPNLKFVVIGPREKDQNDALDNEYMDDLQRRGIVHFISWCDDLRPWYAAMDVFVLPSYREGIPRACMEAAAMMRAVVATDVRGCREVIRNGDTGLLVPPRNVSQLAAAIERLWLDRSLSTRMGQLGRQHIVENFRTEDVTNRLCEFYRHLEDAGNSPTTVKKVSQEDRHKTSKRNSVGVSNFRDRR